MLQALVEALRYTSRFKFIEEIKHLKTFGMHERCTDNPFFSEKKTQPSQKRTVPVPLWQSNTPIFPLNKYWKII